VKKLMVFLKRKNGSTLEEFKEHYENVHAVLGARYFDGLLVDFSRYYPGKMIAFPSDWQQIDSMKEAESDYDAISVYTFRDEASYNEYNRKMRDPAIGGVLVKDEEKFLDRSKCRFGFCDALEGDGVTSR
jgi:hypothetical protein